MFIITAQYDHKLYVILIDVEKRTKKKKRARRKKRGRRGGGGGGGRGGGGGGGGGGGRPFYFWKFKVLVTRYNYSFVRNEVLIKDVFGTQTTFFCVSGFFNVSVYSLFQTLHKSKQLIFPVFRWLLRDLS